ncbi:MAG: DUF2206 domain-containing protein [Halobacteriota archaeon]
MRLSNPLEMNDWRISRFLLLSFVTLALLWATFFVSSRGFASPVLQQVVGGICLLYLPGIAVLRVFRLHKLGGVETPLYAVGISIALIMFTGLLLNICLPFVGINDPLSSFHLLFAFSAVLVGLCVGGYARDRDFGGPTHLRANALSPSVLCLLLLPFLSVFGTYLVNYYAINGIIPLLLICIGAVVIVVTARKTADESIYPVAIFSISLSLLLSNTLISQYLWGSDVFGEANVANVVAHNGIWNPAYAAGSVSYVSINIARYNSVLSISILAPVLMKICGIDATSLFKIVYPLIYALVPLALYQFFRKQMSNMAAFLASFYFAAVPQFFIQMPFFAREEIAQLFLVLVLLLIFNNVLYTKTKHGLLLLFSGALIVSHYGVAYLFMFELVVVYALLFIMDRGLRGTLRSTRNLAFWKSTRLRRGSPNAPRHSEIPLFIVVLFLLITLAWNVYAGQGSTFPAFIQTLKNTVTTNLLSSASTQAQAKVQLSATPLAVITSRLNTLATLLVFLGVLAFFRERRNMRVDQAYVAFVVVGVGLALVTFALPAITVEWNAARLQQLALIILAPFLIFGVFTLCRIPGLMAKVRRRAREPRTKKGLEHKAYVLSAVFLAVLLLFNSGLVFAAENEMMVSPSLFPKDLPFFVQRQDIAGAKWLQDTGGHSSVWGDFYGASIIAAYSNYPMEHVKDLTPWTLRTHFSATDLIYVRAYDVATIQKYGGTNQFLANSSVPLDRSTNTYSANFTRNMSKIYDSGSAIYGL